MKSMNILKGVLFVLFTFAIPAFLFLGCGYKPSSYYAKKELDGNVFVKLNVDLENPRNAVLIKDSMDLLLAQKLGSKLVYTPESADVILNLKISSADMQPIQYDAQGYNKVYRAYVAIAINYQNKQTGKFRSFIVDGEYDFTVDDGASITDTKRFEAIQIASSYALDEVISKIAVASVN